MKNNKGITLVALIITIIILLILAVVAISAVQNGGIIAHAKNAQQEYKSAVEDEGDILSYYSEYIDAQGDVGPWKIKTSNKNEITKTNEDGTITKIEIGAKVNYEAEIGKTYISKADKTGIANEQTFITKNTDNDWRILGLEKGKILLVSMDSKYPDGGIRYDLYGKNSYNNGIEELNNISAIYGTGNGAEYSRSIRTEDIYMNSDVTEEEILNYKYTGSIIAENNKKYTYKWNDITQKLDFKREDWSEWISSTYDQIYFIDGTIINKDNTNNTKTVISNHYWISDLANRISNENIRNILLPNNNFYWCASKCLSVYEEYTNSKGDVKRGDIKYGLRAVNETRSIVNAITYSANTKSENIITSTSLGVRPVVVLKADIQLIDSNNDGTFEIK